MLASKVICDDTFSNKSWSIVMQGMFQLREINQMERDMCQYLEWDEFEAMVRKDFVGIGPRRPLCLPIPLPIPVSNFTPSPPHAHRHPSPPWTAQALSMYSPPSDTPEASPSYSSTSTSPVSSAPPPTPIGIEDLFSGNRLRQDIPR
ncbi:hypothetical protein EDD16DRAFT_1583002 [Pisolithus croceorrhizus]|nr:hypothetical protein EDD16DRAFT_1583002 [Pisolithus croceorrhizus]